ncbi:MAG: L-seryl-tRNA(Sec) selenium transferase [Ktedonobacterales bacterium]|jgi:L-seryl-tRNA(Ser) seleniumtransferase|nr:MAG: L-seryl-tRNA(Sec) selenium transferase [Ktedonobacterales bacterium]
MARKNTRRTQGQHVESASVSAARALPSVDELARDADLLASAATLGDFPRQVLIQAIRETLAAARAQAVSGMPIPDRIHLIEQITAAVANQSQPSLRRVVNATGVILNTNLGRAPLADAAIQAITSVARGYSNLEYDLADGMRASRMAHIRHWLRMLTGAEDALVVNNNAAAILLTLAALASGRDVIISRGELVEIGGGFRIPDVLRQSGAHLIEVGTTNRTYLRDYAEAITHETAAILLVHPSNFRLVGFTTSPALSELVALAHSHDVPLIHDLGSGAVMPTERWGLAHEPTVQESIAAGADLVCFSGDKLMGGPQAGIIAGAASALAMIEHHPLVRAVRIDKLTLVALEATLRLQAQGSAVHDIPVWSMISMSIAEIEVRAKKWAEEWDAVLRPRGLEATILPGESTVGGGSLPGETLPTVLCGVRPHTAALRLSPSQVTSVTTLAADLRRGQPAIVARLSRDLLLFDPRTVSRDEDGLLLSAIRQALARA